MKKYYEVLAMSRVSIEIDDLKQLQCDSSRIKIKVYQYGNTTPSFTSKFYANTKENNFIWEEILELSYSGQKKLGFQVYCQGEGQQNASIQLLFRGVYYPNYNEMGKMDSCHIYSLQGQKKGLLRWQVKRMTKEVIEAVEEKLEDVKPLIPENLIGVIRIYEASLQIINPVFNRKKHPNPHLAITFGEQIWLNEQGKDYHWHFQDIKIEYTPQSSQSIELELIDQGISLLNGSIQCDSIRKLKRYVRHSVSMLNKSQIKVGTLSLELRYMDKDELIGFIYSPQNNPNFTKRYQPQKPTKITPKMQASNSKEIMKKNQSFFQENRAHHESNRYKMSTALHNSDIFLPKTARFPSSKPNSPYISYIDPQKLSDFSPKRKKGWDMSLGMKFDFTRQYRGNPGVGTYKLPSIWGQH